MIDYVFASDGKIRNDQEEIAPVSKTMGMRFYDSKSGVPQDEKDAMDYQSGAILLGPDADGHAIVWDASLDLRKLIAEILSGKVEELKTLHSEEDKVQSNFLFLGRKI